MAVRLIRRERAEREGRGNGGKWVRAGYSFQIDKLLGLLGKLLDLDRKLKICREDHSKS